MPNAHTLAAVAAAALAAAPALADAVSAGGVLVISAGQGNHDATITVNNGSVELDGIPGVAPGASFSNIHQIDYVALRGNNTITVIVTTDRDLALSFDCERGATDLQIVADVSGGAVSLDLDTLLGPGADTISLDVQSTAASLSVSTDLNPGPGSLWFTGAVDSPLPSAGLDVALTGAFAGGSDTVHLDVNSNAAVPALLLSLQTAGGADDLAVTFNQATPATLTCLGIVGMGNGPDAMRLTLGGPGSSVTLLGEARGHNSSDTLAVNVTGSLMSTFRMLGGNGRDEMATTSTGSMAGTPFLAGGKSWDTLTVATGGAQLAAPVLNGGPGYDTAVGFGTFTDCEDINP